MHKMYHLYHAEIVLNLCKCVGQLRKAISGFLPSMARGGHIRKLDCPSMAIHICNAFRR